MDKVCVYYYKCIVIKLDPFCESQVVFDKNCAQYELENMRMKLNKNYPDKDGYTSMFKKQKMNIG